ncbi:hypothetical protein [Morganella morganii]|uniref:hypothetical protein n=1 Tax=Morganella morganii TaxID=582 RepID=UPI001BDA6CA5|nr:hypothetical protein [Morganella morganii]MBT0494112.1 hypothetical protein [Morganella morganii subsp. morganii]QWL94432.1 hypothetical protein IZ186_06345 [Morganella morganii subsp. morganii]
MIWSSNKKIIVAKEKELDQLITHIKKMVRERDSLFYSTSKRVEVEANEVNIAVSEYIKTPQGKVSISILFLNKQYISHLMMKAYDLKMDIDKLNGTLQATENNDDWYKKSMLPLFGDAIEELVSEDSYVLLNYMSSYGATES